MPKGGNTQEATHENHSTTTPLPQRLISRIVEPMHTFHAAYTVFAISFLDIASSMVHNSHSVRKSSKNIHANSKLAVVEIDAIEVTLTI